MEPIHKQRPATPPGQFTLCGQGYPWPSECKISTDTTEVTCTECKRGIENIELALNPAVIKSYRGQVHGDDKYGNTDIEFPTMHAATSWANSCEVSHLVQATYSLAGPQSFNRPVVVTFYGKLG